MHKPVDWAAPSRDGRIGRTGATAPVLPERRFGGGRQIVVSSGEVIGSEWEILGGGWRMC